MKILRTLTILLALTLTIASIAGSFYAPTYERDSASMAAQGVGQDLVDLFIVVPLLLLSFWLTTRGNRKAALLYTGTLAYIMYSYIIYCFGVNFNRFFLIYCATLGLSLYAFILAFSDLKNQGVKEWFEAVPVKLISAYLVFVAVVFYGLWLKSVVPAIIQNSIPKEVKDYGLLVNPVHVIDMVFALPAILIGAVLLWREKSMGYLIASVSLIFMILLTLALAAMVLMLLIRDISEDFTVSVVFGVLFVISTLMLVLLYRRIRPLSSDSKKMVHA